MKTYFLNLSAVFLVTLFSAGCDRGAHPPSSRHPLKISEGGLILVNVLVSDSIEGRFILDTGAGIHVISDSLRRRLRSAPAGNFTGFRHTGERVDFELFQIPSLGLAGIRQENPLAASWSLLDSFKINGILSLKFFENHPFTLDFRDSVLIFETSQTLADRAKTGQRTPIRLHDDRGKSLDVFVDVRAADSLKLECILDTGSPLVPIIQERILPGSTIYSDAFSAYAHLDELGYRHRVVVHAYTYVTGRVIHTNGIESFWAFAKQLFATRRGLPRDRYPLHLKEAQLRYNTRNPRLLRLQIRRWLRETV